MEIQKTELSNSNLISLADAREKELGSDRDRKPMKVTTDLKQINENLESKNKEQQLLLEQQDVIIKSLSSQFGDVTKELQLAASVQQNMLPDPLLIPSIHAAGKFKPAQYIAGDSYDFHLINDNTFAFYVVDVAGHGIASALVSFAIQQHLNSKKSAYGNFERRQPEPIEQVVLDTITELNATFCLHELVLQFFTIVYGQIDLRTGELCFCQAGHPAPLIRNAGNGKVLEHGSGGFPAGMFVDSDFTVHKHQLQANDRLVIYSDGVTDCETLGGEYYGVERLKEHISASASQDVVAAANSLEKDLLEWQDSPVFLDDVSLLVIDYKGNRVGQTS